MSKIYALTEVVEREIEIIPYGSFKDAQTAMFEAYMNTYCNGEPYNDIIDDYRNEDGTVDLENDDLLDIISAPYEAEIDTTSAYINDGPKHDNYDWKIIEIDTDAIR